jgi:hypothetical protein
MKSIMLTAAAVAVVAVTGLGATQASAMSVGQPAVAQTEQAAPVEKVGRRGGRGFRGGGFRRGGFRGGRRFGRGRFHGRRWHHGRRWRKRFGYGVYLPAYSGYGYGYSCRWLRRKWQRTGSRVWYRRYVACKHGY